MGYSKTLEYGDNYHFGGSIQHISVTTVAETKALGTVTLPTGIQIRNAFVDLYIGRINSSSGGAFNWLNTCDLICTKAPVIGTAVTLPAQACYTVGADIAPGEYYTGTNDVKACFGAGETTTIELDEASCLGNNLFLWDAQPIVRVVLA